MWRKVRELWTWILVVLWIGFCVYLAWPNGTIEIAFRALAVLIFITVVPLVLMRLGNQDVR